MDRSDFPINQAASQKYEAMKAVLRQAFELDEAALYDASTGGNANVRVLTLGTSDLGTAVLDTAPRRIGFPFKSFIVLDATDANVQVNMRLGTNDTINDWIPLKKSSQLNLPTPEREAYLYWSAQSSKTMTILFFLKGNLSTNVLNLVNSGGVSISEGSTVNDPVLASSITTVTQLFAADTTRIKAQICNYGGVTMFIGGSTNVTDDSGAKPGIMIPPGGQYAWESTAACYIVSQGAAPNAKVAYTVFK